MNGWATFTGDDWAWLLSWHFTRFATHCKDWSLLKNASPANITNLFASNPETAGKCEYDWSRLEPGDWTTLLVEQPIFSKYCRKWKEFSGDDWQVLLSYKPEFALKCTSLKG